MTTIPKLLLLGGIVSVAGITAYEIRRRRRLRAADVGGDLEDEGVVVVVTEVEPEIVVIAEDVGEVGEVGGELAGDTGRVP
ncbi:MAG: hypothetical protein KF773_22020 [Deltaproteobacteria bacterium]|nr:hypothetical protein [Deltaproteobacteria bacterium]